MIRAGTQDDVPAVLDLVVAAELFALDEVGIVEELLRAHPAAARRDGHGFLVATTPEAIGGVAYYQPWPAADRAWNLTMLAVGPARQGHGIGRHLVAAVEQDLCGRRQRLLLVETSGLPAYAQARAFYAATGYDQEARVRDLWADGDDLVLFRKDLQV